MRQRKLLHYRPKTPQQLTENVAWLRQQMRLHSMQTRHHRELAKINHDHAKNLNGLQRAGYKSAGGWQRTAERAAKFHNELAATHQRLANDFRQQLIEHNKLGQHITKQQSIKPKRRRTQAFATPEMTQGEISSPASAYYYSKPGTLSADYYARLGTDLYNQIRNAVDREFPEKIARRQATRLQLLAIKNIRQHPLYPRMQQYFDLAQRIAQRNLRRPERLGTITDGAPQGNYYNEKLFGFPRSTI